MEGVALSGGRASRGSRRSENEDDEAEPSSPEEPFYFDDDAFIDSPEPAEKPFVRSNPLRAWGIPDKKSFLAESVAKYEAGINPLTGLPNLIDVQHDLEEVCRLLSFRRKRMQIEVLRISEATNLKTYIDQAPPHFMQSIIKDIMLRIRGFPITGKEHPEEDVVSDSSTSSSSEEETDESEEESSEEGPDEDPETDLEEISDEVLPTSLALEEVVKILETLSDDEEPSDDETSEEEESSEESDESTESSSSSDDEGVPEPQEVDMTENLERMKDILQELRAEREKMMEEAQDLHHQAELFDSVEFPHLVHDSVSFMIGKDTK